MDKTIDSWVLHKEKFSDYRLRKKESAVYGVSSWKSSYLIDFKVYVLQKQTQ
jgi:hypothetical protein